MKVSKASKIWLDYHKTHLEKNTVRSYQAIIERFCKKFEPEPDRAEMGNHIKNDKCLQLPYS